MQMRKQVCLWNCQMSMWKCECFNKYASITCQCAYQSMQRRGEEVCLECLWACHLKMQPCHVSVRVNCILLSVDLCLWHKWRRPMYFLWTSLIIFTWLLEYFPLIQCHGTKLLQVNVYSCALIRLPTWRELYWVMIFLEVTFIVYFYPHFKKWLYW